MTATDQHVYDVPGISCEHCKAAIESTVGDIDGVASVDVDVDAKTVAVVGGTDRAIIAALDTAGYEIA